VNDGTPEVGYANRRARYCVTQNRVQAKITSTVIKTCSLRPQSCCQAYECAGGNKYGIRSNSDKPTVVSHNKNSTAGTNEYA